ncbi:MAG TPA: DUF3108 domain-containing protein [Vicinamibacterales bacterium]
MNGGAPVGARWREAAWVTAFAVLAAAGLTWPLLLHPFARLAAPAGAGDPYLNLWILGWDLGTVTREPLALLAGRIFDANIFFPAERTLAYSDHLILQALAVTPIYLVTRSLAFCYNTLLFGSLVAGVLSMYVFARSVTGSRSGALVAGTAWGFMPFHFAHLLHLQLQSLYWLPLTFLFLHRVMAGRRRRDAVWLGVCSAAQATSSVYWGVIGAVALVVGAMTLAAGIGRWRSGALARRLLLAAFVGAVLLAPFAWPYWQVQQHEGFARNLYEASQHEAVATSYLRVPPGNLLYGRTGVLRPAGDAGAMSGRHEGPEQELFPGFAVAILALVGAWRGWRRDSRPLVMTMASVIVLGAVLSLGPDGVRWLYSLLHRFVFGFQAVRAPARFGVLVTFGLSVLAAVGVCGLSRDGPLGRLPGAAGRGVRRIVPLAMLVLVGLEYLNVPLPTVAAPPATTAVGQWLAREPGAGAVLYLPLDGDLGNTPAMVGSLEHRRPIVNGYSGQRPPFFMALVDTLNQVPAAEALWALRDLNVRFIVSPTRFPTDERGPLVERARLSGDTIYELRWTPDAEAAVPRPESPAPPDAGPLPFSRSEKAVYRVLWVSGVAVGVAAGQATFSASTAGGAGAASRHLALALETASWVARFFEAHDRIDTWTDPALLPARQEQHLREGRRIVDRATRFDPSSQTLTVGDGPPLPLPRGARDGLSAFFYARTLPLAVGYTARFPVVEGGRSYVVDLVVERVERIVAGGREVDAFRVAPRLSTGGGRRRTVQTTLWISTDARRVPLVLEIETAFGSFRVELDRYEAG